MAWAAFIPYDDRGADSCTDASSVGFARARSSGFTAASQRLHGQSAVHANTRSLPLDPADEGSNVLTMKVFPRGAGTTSFRPALRLHSFLCVGVALLLGTFDAPELVAQVDPSRQSASSDSSASSGRSSGSAGFSESSPPAYDWLIRDGSVLDGTGERARRTDILLRDGRIAHVGRVEPDTLQVENEFDAGGLVVAPGFIDLHAHGDPVDDPASRNFLAMGVTTIVLGQDGSSPEARRFGEHLEAVDAARPTVNTAYLVGHNTIRRESGVGFGDPGPRDLRRMADLVARAMEAGAFGLSTGLEYSPGGRAGAEELAAVAGPVGARGGVVMSHLRSEDRDRIDDSVDELLEQGRRSGAAVHVSHIKVVLEDDPAHARRILGRLADARRSGLRATGDVYPYMASFTGISLLFPDWALGPNDYQTVVAERRSELAGYLRRRVESRNGPEATLFGSGPWSGRTLAEVAAEQDRPFEEILVDLGPSGASAAYFVMDEAVMTAFLVDPHIAVSSDGGPTMAHPRGYGAFSRVIARYVVEEGSLSLEEAIRKMTSFPASILGLDDSERVEVPTGVIREGWAADVVVFDPGRVRDRATFEEPHRLSSGMRSVWVAGELAWREGGSVGGPGNGRVLESR